MRRPLLEANFSGVYTVCKDSFSYDTPIAVLLSLWPPSATGKVLATINCELQTSFLSDSTPAKVSLFGYVCQFFGCFLTVRVVSQGKVPVYRAGTCTGFPPPQQPSSLLNLGKRALGRMMQQWQVGMDGVDGVPQLWDYNKYVRITVGDGQSNSIYCGLVMGRASDSMMAPT